MNLIRLLLGRPLRSDEEDQERIGPLQGVPVLGLDALASASYGPEAALTALIVSGAAAPRAIVPVTAAIGVLLLLVYVSYRQTIAAYPNGGGSFTVAKENLGATPGLVAAAALTVDYVLNAAVAISAGVGAVVSAIPSLLPHTLTLCLLVLGLLTLVNLRGIRAAGAAFMAPTYVFVATLLLVIGVGLVRAFTGAPVATAASRAHAEAAAGGVGLWLLLRAFANGCTAMTGVEAVSNGVPLFRKPAVPRARLTLTMIVGLLLTLIVGLAAIVRTHGITATEPGQPG